MDGDTICYRLLKCTQDTLQSCCYIHQCLPRKIYTHAPVVEHFPLRYIVTVPNYTVDVLIDWRFLLNERVLCMHPSCFLLKIDGFAGDRDRLTANLSYRRMFTVFVVRSDKKDPSSCLATRVIVAKSILGVCETIDISCRLCLVWLICNVV